MTPASEHRYEVAFSASQAPDGRPIITLTLCHNGQPMPDEGNTFFLEPKPTIASEAAPAIADFLSKYVTGFGVLIHEQNNGKPEGKASDGAAG